MIPPTDLLDFGALCLGESQWSSPGSLCPSLWFPNSAPLIAASLSRIVAVLDGLRFFAIPRMEVPFGLGLPRHLPIPRYPRGSISPQLAPSSIQVTSPHPTLPANAARWRAGARPLWLLCATPAGLRSPAIGGAHHIHGFSSTLSRPQSKWLVEESSSNFFLSTAHPATVAGLRTATTVPTKQLTSSAAVPPRRD